jgi:hypothetical protein
MSQFFKNLSAQFQIKNKKLKFINYSAAGLIVIYLTLIVNPGCLFAHTFRYKNFSIHSTRPFPGNIKNMLDEAEYKVSAAEINNNDVTHHIYLCNNFKLYTFFAPLSRKAFACNYPFINNIFIANSDVEKNESYKNDTQDVYSRPLSTLIAHEATHTLIEKKTGTLKYRMLSTWKNEGYCDYIGYGPESDIQKTRELFKTIGNDGKPGTAYKKYFFAVNYLMTVKKMTFEELLATKLTCGEVLALAVETHRADR